jgi:hypothetical protein
MTTPMAREITRRLESVARDSFVDHLPAAATAGDASPHAPAAQSTTRVGRPPCVLSS